MMSSTNKQAHKQARNRQRKTAKRQKAKENGKCEVGERKTRGNWQKKVNARDEFATATWMSS